MIFLEQMGLRRVTEVAGNVTVPSHRLPGGPVPGERFGEYRLLREIGRGGMGIVYEAEEERLRRRVALKVLPDHSLGDRKRRERFQREAQAAARLQHASIVAIHGLGETAGIPFFAMQLVEGRSLEAILPEVKRITSGSGGALPHAEEAPSDPLTSSIALRLVQGAEASTSNAHPPAAPPAQTPARFHQGLASVGLQVAEALSYAHSRGVLHRDIKPSNILLDERGHAWVADFGLAKAFDLSGLTQSGEVVGTLRYMAPERFSGISDARGDVYSLGLTLYELLTLTPAFHGEDRKELFGKILAEEPTRPRDLDPSIPGDLETIILKAIAKERGARYASAEDLAADLRRYLAGEGIRARRPHLSPARGRRWALGVLAAAFLTCLVLVIAPRDPLEPFAASTVAVGNAPQQAIALDLTGDGALDLVTANFQSNDVSILVNTAGGEFAKALGLPAGKGPRCVVGADLDGDGQPDLAAACVFSSEIFIHFLRGMTPLRSLQVPLPARALWATAGDFDSDGQFDLAAVSGERSLVVLRGSGGGRFAESGSQETGRIPNFVAAADLNGDSRLDLVSTAANDTPEHVSVFWNQDAGTFSSAAHLDGAPSASALALLDFEGDGDLDIAGIARTAENEVRQELWLIRNEGQGNFGPCAYRPLEAQVENLASGDLDGDGQEDLVLAGGQHNVLLLRNAGRGTFEHLATLSAGAGPGWVLPGDWNRDGKPDLAVVNSQEGSVTFLRKE
jgi:serine/threonine protein kinase